jgi:outer membrane protein assembly factor BamB/predicted phosphodiesterase
MHSTLMNHQQLWRAVLSRRELLKLGLVAWIAPGSLGSQRDEPWRFIVCSDTHFGIAGALEKNRPLLEEMTRYEPQLALIAGDITERAWAEEYDEVERALAGLPFPIHAAPGNHDVRWAPLGLQIFQNRMGPPHAVFTHGGCGFVLLDTTVPLSHWGHVGGPQRRWLAAELERLGPDLPLFVFMHHATGRDPAAVDDQDAVAEVLAPYNTKVIFTGHGHSDLVWDWHGITHTMGRGLYQGSYQIVEVDPTAGEVRLLRRTDKSPEPAQFAQVPLARETRVARGTQPTPGADAADRQTVGALRPLWQQSLGGGVMSHLLLHDNTLYVSAMDGTVSAFDPADGRVRWRATTGGYCHSSPVVADQTVIIGSADGSVYCFASDVGTERWRFATRGPVYASAAIAQGLAMIASGDGSVYGIDLQTGTLRWRWALPPSSSAFSQSPAATDGERVFIGAWDRHVYALDVVSGREVWRYEVPDAGFYYSPAIGAPALRDGRLYVPSNRNKLHALDAATGRLVWMQSSPGDSFGYSSPRVVGDRIYIGCLGDKGEVRCLAAEDGHELWATGTGAVIYDSSPAIAAGKLAIGSVNGTLWLLRAADGAILGSHRFPPGHFLSSPAAEPGRVYAATFAEILTAFEVISPV